MYTENGNFKWRKPLGKITLSAILCAMGVNGTSNIMSFLSKKLNQLNTASQINDYSNITCERLLHCLWAIPYVATYIYLSVTNLMNVCTHPHIYVIEYSQMGSILEQKKWRWIHNITIHLHYLAVHMLLSLPVYVSSTSLLHFVNPVKQ